MPNRVIKESVCSSESIDKMSWFEECFFYRLLVNCDDYGCMDARPKILKAKLFPLKDRLSLKDIEDALHRMADIGCVRLYECDGKPYLYLPSWGAHQTIRAKRRKYPDPESCESTCKQMLADDSNSPRNPIQSESESNPNISPPAAETKHKYGEHKNVLLTDGELRKLKERYPDWQKKIENLSNGIAMKGYKYKSHYLAIIKWAERDGDHGANGKPPATPKANYGTVL